MVVAGTVQTSGLCCASLAPLEEFVEFALILVKLPWKIIAVKSDIGEHVVIHLREVGFVTSVQTTMGAAANSPSEES